MREAPLEAHLRAHTSRPRLARATCTALEAEDRQTVLTGLQAVRAGLHALAK